MVGKNVGSLYPKTGNPIGDTALEVINLSDEDNIVSNISFSVHAGEIVGLYGLVGSGALECPEMLFGLWHKTRGTIRIHNKSLPKLTAANAIKNGVAYIPADRHREGIITRLSIRINLTLAILRRISGFMFVKRVAENNIVGDYIKRLCIRCNSGEQAAAFLSGGNQQKVVIAKWLASRPRILILNDPTRGVDVGSRAEIYGIISELAAAGMAVVITSSDIDEIMGMSDRIIVFNKGSIVREIERKDATQNELLAAANMELRHDK
jgi:ABC-type sugar transport system ATPase subunit